MNRAAIKAAVQKRHSYIADNLESLSLKKCRQLIAKDLGLQENGLDGEKKYVVDLIDEIVTLAASNVADPTPQKKKASPVEKRKKADHCGEGKKKQCTGVVKGSSTQAVTSYGAIVDKLKGVCKAASITVPPGVYTRVSSAQDVEDRLRTLLAKHGLSEGSSCADTSRVRKRLAKERDLEGIDTSNIVVAGRRSRTKGEALQSRHQSSKGGEESSLGEEDDDGIENARPSNICSRGRPEVGMAKMAPQVATADHSSSSDAECDEKSDDEDVAAHQQAPEAYKEQTQEAANAEAAGGNVKRRVAAWSDDDD